jgi:hypothetical protein
LVAYFVKRLRVVSFPAPEHKLIAFSLPEDQVLARHDCRLLGGHPMKELTSLVPMFSASPCPAQVIKKDNESIVKE